VTRRSDPLEPELDALLEAERAARAPEAVLDRVWSEVERSVAFPGPGGSHRTESLRAGQGAGWITAHAGPLVALAFGAGAVAGAGATLVLRTPAERIVYVERAAPAATSSTTADVAQPAVVAPAPVVAPADVALRAASHPSVPNAAAVPSSASSLPAERAILDTARNALAQNDGARAIALTDEHARRFAHPQLGEEREAIAIQAMVLEGRYGEARERGRRFRTASPDSLFLPTVEASLASIP
jgi:hypothetical protein